MTFFMLFVLLIVWGVSAIVAGAIASDRERSFFGFAVVTFFFLGPLGPGFALIAAPGWIEEPTIFEVAEGRRRFVCPRCCAENDIPKADASFNCWRCSEHRKVKAAGTVTKP
jgi:DNA-directed RNA polymerase subunit RPC12/RpoP